MIPYQLLRDNTMIIAVVHAYTRKRGLERTVVQRTKRSRKEKKKRKERKEKRNKKSMHARRAQAESRGDKKTRRKARSFKENKERKTKEEKRAATQSSRNQTSIYMSSWWGKDDTRDPIEGRDRGAKIILMIKRKTNITKNETNSNIGWRSRCRDAEYGGTIDLAGNRATQQRTEIGNIQVWISFHPLRQCAEDAYSLGVSLQSA